MIMFGTPATKVITESFLFKYVFIAQAVNLILAMLQMPTTTTTKGKVTATQLMARMEQFMETSWLKWRRPCSKLKWRRPCSKLKWRRPCSKLKGRRPCSKQTPVMKLTPKMKLTMLGHSTQVL
jgi:hypothetical protein